MIPASSCPRCNMSNGCLCSPFGNKLRVSLGPGRGDLFISLDANSTRFYQEGDHEIYVTTAVQRQSKTLSLDTISSKVPVGLYRMMTQMRDGENIKLTETKIDELQRKRKELLKAAVGKKRSRWG